MKPLICDRGRLCVLHPQHHTGSVPIARRASNLQLPVSRRDGHCGFTSL
uniref:Uncharacterized protein n=1 Tax=Anguilla anguilla TaxID=7936 RepID=A0A0E9UCB1_ANGAN